MDELRLRILEKIFGTRDPARIPTLALDEGDRGAIRELWGRKYGMAAWNYGENPASNVQRANRFAGGEIDVRLDVKDGRIASIRIFGDFRGRRDVSELEGRLTGVLYERDAVMQALTDLDVGEFFSGINADEVMSVLAP